MNEGLPGWRDYHPERVWPNELPRSEKQRTHTVNRRVYRGYTRVWEPLFLAWERLADGAGIPDADRRWRWCPWPRSPFYTEVAGNPLEGDVKREGRRPPKQTRWSR